MREFLIEFYISRVDVEAIELAARRARAAADELTEEGTPVRLVHSMFLTEDETCFFLYEAESAAAVRMVAQRAGVPIERVCAVITDRADPGPGTHPPPEHGHRRAHVSSHSDTNGDPR